MYKILCAEALWDRDISQDRSSYKSLLDLVRNETGCEIAYFTFNTPEELEYLFEVFGKKKYNIFYLASHMENGYVKSGHDSRFYTHIIRIIKQNSEFLSNKILHLAGCSSLSEISKPGGNLSEIIQESKLKILSGYIIDTDTTESSAMDLLYLTSMIREPVSKFKVNLNTRYKQLAEVSGFKMYTNKET